MAQRLLAGVQDNGALLDNNDYHGSADHCDVEDKIMNQTERRHKMNRIVVLGAAESGVFTYVACRYVDSDNGQPDRVGFR